MGQECSKSSISTAVTKTCRETTVYERLVTARNNLLDIRDTVNHLGIKIHEGQEMPDSLEYNRFPNLSLVDLSADVANASEELLCRLRDLVQIL